MLLTDCCQPDMVLKRDSKDCHCVYPIKLDLLLLNVSQNPDWKVFLQDFAKQLGLQASQIELINFYVLGFTRLNISMDITPQTGLSFSASDAYAINSSLSLHQVHLSPSLVGDYKLLNITWFKAPPPSEGKPHPRHLFSCLYQLHIPSRYQRVEKAPIPCLDNHGRFLKSDRHCMV